MNSMVKKNLGTLKKIIKNKENLSFNDMIFLMYV